MSNPKSISIDSFGRVESPLFVDTAEEQLATSIVFGIKDLRKLMNEIHWYYRFKSDRSQRQEEIAELAAKLERLLSKEKKVYGRFNSPVKLIIPREDW